MIPGRSGLVNSTCLGKESDAGLGRKKDLLRGKGHRPLACFIVLLEVGLQGSMGLLRPRMNERARVMVCIQSKIRENRALQSNDFLIPLMC